MNKIYKNKIIMLLLCPWYFEVSSKEVRFPFTQIETNANIHALTNMDSKPEPTSRIQNKIINRSYASIIRIIKIKI